MTVSVLVPWRSTSPDRAEAFAYAVGWWRREHPDWEVVAGTCPDGPWVKALAVGAALEIAGGDVLVVADADVLVPGVAQAVHQVEHGAPWAIPHTRVHRLGQAASQHLYATGELPTTATPTRRTPPGVHASYNGVDGGGCVVLSRAMYDRVPLDPRFTGWGQEDQAWARGLDVVAGPPWRSPHPLWHLWHEPARVLRMGETAGPDDFTRLTRAIGSNEGAALFRRYRATGNPADMLALIDEFRTVPVAPPGDSTR